MRLIIFESQELELTSKEDLAKVIPDCYSGEALNYGQGEGQIKIENSVWGLYVGSDNNYYLTYEEGMSDFERIKEQADNILATINTNFNLDAIFAIEGVLNGEADV